MTTTFRVHLLGGTALTPTQGPLPSRSLALLGLLVVRAGTPQPRAYLAETMWPDSDGAQARTNLRRELHHLRATLGDTGSLRVAADTLCWDDGPLCRVDVREFVLHTQRAVRAMANEDGAAVDRHAHDALDSYGGPFLPGCYEDWALAAREELQRTCVDLCDRLAMYWRDHGDLSAAIDAARRRLVLEPVEESGYQLLMGLFRDIGDRAGAMRTYHQCVSVLEQELGVPPSAATELVLGSLDAAPSMTPAPGPRRIEATPLVGRADDRRRMHDEWLSAQERLPVPAGDGGGRHGQDPAGRRPCRPGSPRGRLGRVRSCFAATSGLAFAPVAEWLRAPELRRSAERLPPMWRREVARLLMVEPAAVRGPGRFPGGAVAAATVLRGAGPGRRRGGPATAAHDR